MIVIPPGPDGALAIVQTNAPRLLEPDVLRALEVEPEIGQPWPVYMNTLDRLTNGQLINGATHVAWEYPLLAGDDALGLAVLSIEPLQWDALHPRPFAERTLLEMVRAQASPEVGGRNYELRILEVPSVSLRAIWLRPAGGGDEDLFRPVGRLTKQKDEQPDVLRESDLLSALTGVTAERRVATGKKGA
jgi:hypothetical protein